MGPDLPPPLGMGKGEGREESKEKFPSRKIYGGRANTEARK